jgi:hypothetical protein
MADTICEDMEGYTVSHIIKDMNATVFQAVVEASKEFRIFAGTEEDKQALALGRTKCWFFVGNKMKQSINYWKSIDKVLKKDDEELSIEVSYEEVAVF